MKFNIIQLVIAVALAALIGLLLFSLASVPENAKAIGITTGLSLAVTLVPAFAMKLENGRITTNVRVLSLLFAAILLVVHVVVCFLHINNLMFYYIIVGIVALLYLSVLAKLSSIKDA